MNGSTMGTVAILFPGDEEARRTATTDNNRFADLFAAFAAGGISAEPAVYHDDFSQEVRAQLLQVDAVLVWVNPIQGGRDRSVLDSMLREVAESGVFVSAHPDIILKLGTKEILYRTRHMSWGTDTRLYRSMTQMQEELPASLQSGKARVVKQYRGQSGEGVWKIQLAGSATRDEPGSPIAMPQPDTVARVRHARRGETEEEISLADFYDRCEPYFAGDGQIIDQAYQERLTEGMIRCYLVKNVVAGFGHQAINALYPAPDGVSVSEAPEPGPRLYFPPTRPDCQALKHKLEQTWLPELQQLMAISTDELPILWDCDFLLGPIDEEGTDTYVLCEINVSSVAPYPESAVPAMVHELAAHIFGPNPQVAADSGPGV